MFDRRSALAGLVILFFVVAGCEGPQPVGPEPGTPQWSHGDDCHPTGTGLTAKVVNEDVINRTIDIGGCDVGAFFDRNGRVRSARFVQPDDDAGPQRQFLVRVEGAKVDVTDSEFEVTDDYRHEIVHIAHVEGASGRITGNTLTGFKRAGILLDGEGTNGNVRGNVVTGIGPKDEGWAENGIQVSRGASGVVADNVVTDHWWDLENFFSSGIIVFESDGVNVQHNDVLRNDGGVVLWGDRNNGLHNTITVEDGENFAGWVGVLIFGDNNGARQNEISGDPAAFFGIWIFDGVNNKLIRNRIDGFETKIEDGGDDTKLPRPFDPDA